MPRPPSSSAPSASPAVSAAEAEPLGAGDFARLIAACGPFEPRPSVAVAVSGGPDSLALTLLLQDWLAQGGGRLTALVVDHRLRPESEREAEGVAALLRARGLAVRLMRRPYEPLRGGWQAAARAARYALLTAACREAGILHLALAHHRDDQAETVLLRQAAGSGPDGLAGMAAVSERPEVRLIRPLLPVPKARLVATCHAAGLPFVEDPSNRDPRFSRSRLRRDPRLADARWVRALTGQALVHGLARATRERAAADLLVEGVALHPAGFARLSASVVGAEDALALRALANLLACVSGAQWPARTARLQAGLTRLRAGAPQPFTLGGCRLMPEADGWLLVREPAARARATLHPGESLVWDGRFFAHLPADAPRSLSVNALGTRGWQALVRQVPALRAAGLPAPARVVLPLFSDLEGPVAVPHLGFLRRDWQAVPLACAFRPRRPLAPAEFALSFTVA